MTFDSYPILKILLPFVFGIILAYYCYLPLKYCYYIGIFLVIILPVLAYFMHYKDFKWQRIATILLQTCFLFVGFLLTTYRSYPHLDAQQENLLSENQDWIISIADFPLQKEKTTGVMAEIVSSSNHHILRKNAVIYFQNEENPLELHYGDQLLIHTKISLLSSGKNPYSFDYKRYMQNRGVFFTGYVPTGRWKKIGFDSPPFIRTFAKKIQQIFSHQFARAGMNGDEYGVITAILLGDVDALDPELRQSYASAGVSHILCVSGLHVGIIFMILNFLLKPLDLSKKSALLKALLLLASIWGYSSITGLSPSVSRSATMFSFVTVGGLLHRNCNIYHSLFTSFFILLLFNPLLLFNVGFQLSYLAVMGIAIIQPLFAKLWTPKNKIVNYFWQLITVSMAAQIATAPLSIYYFAQFPNYFLLANMSVIMLSTVVMVTGIVTLALFFSPFLLDWMGTILTFEIKLMNGIIQFIEALPGAVTNHIHLGFLPAFLSYLLIVIVLAIAIFRNKKLIFAGLINIMILLTLFLKENIENQQRQTMTCYAMGRTNAISFNHHGKALILADSAFTKQSQLYKYNIEPHEIHEEIESQIMNFNKDTAIVSEKFYKNGDFILFGDTVILIANQTKRYYESPKKVTVDYLIVMNNSRCHLEYMIKALNIREVILAESNSSYTRAKWIDACLEYKIPLIERY
ncbi:MAG: competence protein ComEC family protein [Bacteroidales bacterium]|jgi:competence protein ComEC|nr:competence protein ComEC family protein [Bacteroidales bacterium]